MGGTTGEVALLQSTASLFSGLCMLQPLPQGKHSDILWHPPTPQLRALLQARGRSSSASPSLSPDHLHSALRLQAKGSQLQSACSADDPYSAHRPRLPLQLDTLHEASRALLPI